MRYAVGATIGAAFTAGLAFLLLVTPNLTPQQAVVVISYAFILALMLITLLALMVSILIVSLQNEQPIERLIRKRMEKQDGS